MKHTTSNSIAAQWPDSLRVLYRAVQNNKRLPELNVIFNTLGNNHRRILFDILCRREAQIDDLVLLTSSSYQSIRKQLRLLEESGLITSYKDRNLRYFHAAPDSLIMLQIWANTMGQIIKRFS